MADEMLGRTLLGKLRVVRKLGAGGLGAVYEVEHLLTNNRHALKVLHRDQSTSADAVSRLIREAGVAGRVRSSRLVQTLDVGQLEDGRTYLLMELLEGRSWRQLLKEEGRLHPTEVVRFGLQVCEGLAVAHAAGVIHRDLKPDNVFLVGPRGREEVKLLDFGLAKNLPGFTDQFGALTEAGGLMGTPQYLSPEQGTGTKDVDGRSDQYALAVMLYESLTGHPPFVAPSIAELILKIHEGRFPPINARAPHVPHALCAVIERAMTRDRELRYAVVETFARALAPFASQAVGTARTDQLEVSPARIAPARIAPARVAPERIAPAHTPALPHTGPVQPLPTHVRPMMTPVASAHRAPPPARRAPWPLFLLSGALALLLLVGGGVGVVVWRSTHRRSRPAARTVRAAPVAPVPEVAAPIVANPLPVPEPAARVAGPTRSAVSDAMQAFARALPTEAPGLVRERIFEEQVDGSTCVATFWRRPGAPPIEPGEPPHAQIVACNGLSNSPYNIWNRERSTAARSVRVDGQMVRYIWMPGVHQSNADVRVEDRYRVYVVVRPARQAIDSVDLIRLVDLRSIAAIAPRG